MSRRYWSTGEDAMLNGVQVHVQDTDFLNQEAKVGVVEIHKGDGETRRIVPDARWVGWDALEVIQQPAANSQPEKGKKDNE